MELISIIVAAVAVWVWGAIWYSLIGKSWMKASGLTEESINRRNPVPFIVSFACVLAVSGVMNHILYRMNATVEDGAVIGLTMGLFVVLPWMITNIFFGKRSKSLIWMDGIYPVIGMAIMGLILTMLAQETYVAAN